MFWAAGMMIFWRPLKTFLFMEHHKNIKSNVRNNNTIFPNYVKANIQYGTSQFKLKKVKKPI